MTAWFKFNIFLLLTTVFFVLSATLSLAASYDIYVDKSYDGEEEGSSEKPYQTIEKAISESSSKGKKIYVKNGEYKETIKLTAGVEIYGQDKNKTVIKGEGLFPVTLESNNALENIKVSGGQSAITVLGKANIKNCVVTNASKNAINLTESSSQATIEKSELYASGKGVYVQKGRKISFSGNYIHGNSEEGLDIREKVQGTISGNDIIGNGESGIEIVLGSSNVKITNNNIKKNKSCGITSQFYSQASRTGKVSISKNTISRNGKYGICCAVPSGDDSPRSYWIDSLDITENKIELNKQKSISGSCHIIDETLKEDEKTNEVIENSEGEQKDVESSNPEEEARAREEQAKKEAEARIAQENEKNTLELINQVQNEKIAVNSLILEEKQTLLKENKVKVFFIGHDAKKISALRENNGRIKEKIFLVQEALKRIDSETLISDGQKLVDEINVETIKTENFAREKEQSFSLLGWLKNIFNFKLFN